MVTCRLSEELAAIVDAAAFWVFGAVIEAFDAGERDRGGAHRTGFERDIKMGAGKALGTVSGAGLTDRQNFGMGRRIGQFSGLVAGRRKNDAVFYHDSANRDFATQGRFFRFFKRQRHEIRRSGHFDKFPLNAFSPT